MIVCTSPQVYADARRMEQSIRLKIVAQKVLEGTCFYNQYAREIGEANGWSTCSATRQKLSIFLAVMAIDLRWQTVQDCVNAAIEGRSSDEGSEMSCWCRAKVRGEALVADDNFSARYDLDRIKGVFSRPQHKLAGQSCEDKDSGS